MTDRKSPKKSEMLEVRLPHPTKVAFMNKAHAEGRPASEIVRESIDHYLAGTARHPTLLEKSIMYTRRHAKPLLLLAAAIAATGLASAISPASARPDLRAAFSALDINRDGQISEEEFTRPSRALTVDLATPAPTAPGAVAVAGEPANGSAAYVRFVLDSGTSDGVLPLYVVVRVPEGGLAGADLSRLVGTTFAALDVNHDGRLTADEFRRG